MANKQQPIEMITPPNMLRVKVGGRIGPVDEAAIARAEKALDDMKDVFSEWLETEVVKLEAAAKRVQTEGLNGEAGEALFGRAHDLRGMGTTYNFPIITRMAASLSKLIETPEKREIATMVRVNWSVAIAVVPSGSACSAARSASSRLTTPSPL